MSGQENVWRRSFVFTKSGIPSVRHRRIHAAVLATAMGGCAWPAVSANAATLTTSATPPSGPNVQISQPDNTGTNPSNYRDYTDQQAGAGQVFTPLTNFSMTSFTFQGGGGAGNDLTGPWTVYVGQLKNGNYYGATITPLDTETADGAAVATDVSNGLKTNYDTVTLATPIALNANQLYYWAVHTPNGYYQLAGTPTNPATYNQNSTSVEYPGGESINLDPANNPPTDFIHLQNADRTFYISGNVATSTATQWALNGNGNWQTGANWTSGSAPQFAGDAATLGSDNGAVTVSPVVTLSAAVTVDTLTFSAPAGNSAGGYNISNGGLGQINVGNLSNGSAITVTSGNHQINVPVYLVGNYSVNPAASLTVGPNSSLSIQNLTGGSYGNVNIAGGGSLTVDKLDTMNLGISGGTVVTTTAGGATTRGGYDNFASGTVLNINTTFEMFQLYDDGTDKINIGSAGSLVPETNGNSGEYIGGTIAGTGSINIGGSADNTTPNGGVQLNGTNSNFSGPILVTNGFQLRLGSQYSTGQQSANSWGNDSATNTLTLDNGKLWIVPTITAGVATSYIGNHIVIINAGGGTIETNDANDSAFSGGSNAGAFTLGIGSISGQGTLTVDGGGNLAVAAQVVAANASGGIRTLSLGGLNLINNSNASFGSAALQKNRTVLVIGSGGLSLSGATGAWTSALDLGGNDMIVQNGLLATVGNQLRQGYAGGTWQGSGGIVSSKAAADTKHLTTLAAVQNSTDGTSGGNVLYPTFDGVPSTASDILVKYTYYGDANLDGIVNGSDYTLIDNGFNRRLTGWLNGDFNGDGVVDGSDYTLIDNAFLSQGAALTALIAAPAAVTTSQVAGYTAAVPEPASLSLLGIGAAALLRRRNRPHR